MRALKPYEKFTLQFVQNYGVMPDRWRMPADWPQGERVFYELADYLKCFPIGTRIRLTVLGLSVLREIQKTEHQKFFDSLVSVGAKR